MTEWYWKQRGGTLIEEFRAVDKGPEQGERRIDGLIVLGGAPERHKRGWQMPKGFLRGKDVVVVQAKNARLGMYLIGQTLFSADLIRPFEPASVESVALCARTDAVMQPRLEAHEGCRVVVCPHEICNPEGP